ncbi:hypothetical protein Enr13x_44010 [Stieleria neptunia]|uniref:Uncharacterized protein n=1 Tax=Stieleria neptunia TaxID=2527979 RepID=A0A518HUK3_9BACT|nr:hypothetical protein Enr13x_44010 [Stieleria neptunia]
MELFVRAVSARKPARILSLERVGKKTNIVLSLMQWQENIARRNCSRESRKPSRVEAL